MMMFQKCNELGQTWFELMLCLIMMMFPLFQACNELGQTWFESGVMSYNDDVFHCFRPVMSWDRLGSSLVLCLIMMMFSTVLGL